MIPFSDEVNTSSFSKLFENKSESYKLFWFKAILDQVRQGNSEIYFRSLIEKMIVDAWYMVSEYKLNLGPADTLEKTVLYLQEKTQFKPTEKEDVIYDYIRNAEDNQLKAYMRTLCLNVPYRLQAPLIETPKASVWHKTREITEYINNQSGIMYHIHPNGTLESKIIITPSWMDYLRSNLGIILGWTDYNLILYLQRRNPTVPGIADKIYPPQERKLTAATGYWKYLITSGNVRDIYTGELLTTKDLSIDHFVPWSYVASDELWNLIPTTRSVNSKKSNNLPKWDVYFTLLANTEFDAYLAVSADAKAKQLFEKCAKENINNEDIRYRLYRQEQNKESFTRQLEEILLPIYDSAKNMGFKEWIL